MRITKYSVAWLACLLIVLSVLCGCSTITQPPATVPTEAPTTPPTVAPTEPEGFRLAANVYSGSDITEFTVEEITKYIDEGAFANCKALENFYCSSMDITIHENAFTGSENVVFHCYLDSTVDMFAREHGFDRVYFDAFSIECDTVKNGCAGLPITWSAVDVMPGQDIVSEFVYTVYLNGEPVFTSEPTTEDHFSYTPDVGGEYHVTVEIRNDLTTSSLTSEVVPAADKLLMGQYEQDDDLTSTEPIEWRILTVEDGKALILSEYLLTKGSYFNPEWIKFKYTYWANSCLAETREINYWGSAPVDPSRMFTLTIDSVPLAWYGERGHESELFYLHARYWCNEVFYKEHLSEEERTRVLLSDLSNPDNPRSGITGGSDTQDYVFFLSFEEVEEFLPTKQDRKAYFTTYSHNQPLEYGTNTPVYWLRSPGHNRISAMIVWAEYGGLDYLGSDVGHNNVCYRPAMWITIGG